MESACDNKNTPNKNKKNRSDVGQTDSSVVPEVVTAAPSGSLFLLESPVQNSPGVTSVFLVGEQNG